MATALPSPQQVQAPVLPTVHKPDPKQKQSKPGGYGLYGSDEAACVCPYIPVLGGPNSGERSHLPLVPRHLDEK